VLPAPLATHANGATTGPCSNLPARNDHAGWVAHYEARLKPCGEKTGTAELTSCLALTAPSGMTATERANWLKVARHTLKGMPQDLLQAGCQHARETADHPAKVVPAIVRYAGPLWQERMNRLREERSLAAPRLEPPDRPAIPHEETQRIIAEVAAEMQGEA